jgi:hypothetical protein
MAKQKVQSDTVTIPVSFGNVSCGDKTCRIGVTVDRSVLSVSKAEKMFCERRIIGSLVNQEQEHNPDQGRLPGMENEPHQLDAIFDVKGISISGDTISFNLTFLLGSLGSDKLLSLVKFAKRAGKLVVDHADDIPEPEKKKENDNGGTDESA